MRPPVRDAPTFFPVRGCLLYREDGRECVVFAKKQPFSPVKNWDTPEAAREAEARELAQQDEALRHGKIPRPAYRMGGVFLKAAAFSGRTVAGQPSGRR